MKVLKDIGILAVFIEQFHIIEELKFHNSYRSKEDRQLLKDQIRLEGVVRDPLVFWNFENKKVLVDGFTRLDICNELNQEAKDAKLPIPFPSLKCHLMEFESLDEVKYWITLNQNSRRNLTDVQRTFQMGHLYNSLLSKEKVLAYLSARGEASGSNDSIVKDENVRSVLLSKHFNVNERTVRRAADYAQGIDRIRKEDENMATAILRGEKVDDVEFNQKVVMEIGKLESKDFKSLKWKDASDLIEAIKGDKSKPVEKEKTPSQKVKDAVQEFLSSPTQENLQFAQSVMKDYLTKVVKQPLKVA
jgi:negative regulator of replication initiation